MLGGACVAALCWWSAPAQAQFASLRSSPVYADDSPLAAETIRQAPGLVAGGNEAEAVRTLQFLLETRAHQVVATPDDPDLFIGVREAVHGVILRDPALLGWYREAQGPAAQAMLDRGEEVEVEQTRLLTPAGFEASLRVAQRRMERGRFESALLALEQLETHPDLPERSADAARLLMQVGVFLGREDVRERARAWASAGGIDPDGLSISGAIPATRLRPPVADVHGIHDDDDPADLELGTIQARPIAEKNFEIGLEGGTQTTVRTVDESGRRAVREVDASGGWTLPVLVGETLLLNTGSALQALDRLTLEPRWRAASTGRDPAASRATRSSRVSANAMSLRSVRSVGVGEGIAVATLGEGYESVVVGVEIASGQIRWTWTPEIGSTFPLLDIDGAPVVCDGVAVVGLSLRDQTRRSWSQQVIGFDVRTGAALWRRSIGSAGLSIYTMPSMPASLARGEGGVVYRSDALGLMSAIEAGTGRVRWVRRSPIEPQRQGWRDWPSLASAPVFVDGQVVMLSGDRERVLRLDMASGALLEEMLARRIGKPEILIESMGTVLAFGTQVGYRMPGGLMIDSVRMRDTGVFPIGGRPVATRGWEAVPGPGGVGLRTAGDGATRLTLPAPSGAVVVLSRGQVVIAGESTISSFLSWDVVPDLLRERIARDVSDPSPGLTLASLAFRAGQSDVLLEGLDASVLALSLGGGSGGVDRRVVFEATLGMVRSLVERDAPSTRERALATSLLERLAELRDGPEDEVWLRLLSSRVALADGRAARAASEIRALLEDPALAPLWWEDGDRLATVGAVARGRLEMLAREGGRAALDEADAAAAREFAMLGEGSTPDDLRRVAQAHPIAASSAEALLRAGEGFAAADRRQFATLARLEGLRVLRAIESAGGVIDRRIAGRLAGGLARDLADWGRAGEALRIAESFGPLAGPVGLLDGDAPLPVDALQRERARGAQTGALGETPLSTIAQWRVLAPIAGGGGAFGTDGASSRAAALVRRGPEGGVWLGALRVDRAAEAGWDEPAWMVELDDEPTLLWIDEDGFVVLDGLGIEGRLMKRSIEDGSVIWDAGRVDALLGGVTARAAGWGRASGSGVLVGAHSGVLALGSWAGRVAGVDLATGAMRWRHDAGDELVDLTVGAGLVVIAGRSAREAESLEGVDIWTGERVVRLDPGRLLQSGRIRWLRSDDRGGALVGLSEGIGRIDLGGGEGSWRLTTPRAAGAVDLWAVSDHAVLMGWDRELAVIDLEVGIVRALPAPLSLSARSGGVACYPLGDQTMIRHSGGVFMVDRTGRVRSQMRLAPGRKLAMITQTAGGWIGLLENPEDATLLELVRGGNDGRLLGRGTPLRLAEGDQVESITALDGAVLLSTSAGTIVMPAPVAGGG